MNNNQGEPIDVISAVVHDFERIKHQNGKLNESPKPLLINNLVIKLVSEMHDMYRQRPTKSRGKFETGDAALARKYLEQLEIGSLNFYDFSLKMAENLVVEANKASGSTGGHVFFCEFKADECHHILIALVNDRQAMALKQFDLSEVEYLDTHGVRFAGAIDVSKWRNNDERCVSFLKGSGDVADYFKSFLSCNTAISNLQDTKNLADASSQFISSIAENGEKLSESRRDEFLRRVDCVCRKLAETSQPIFLENFANELWPSNPAQFLAILTKPEFALSDGFIPHKKGLSNLIKFSGKSAHWELEFDRQALLSKEIVFNEDDSTLTLNNLPEELVKRLREEYSTK